MTSCSSPITYSSCRREPLLANKEVVHPLFAGTLSLALFLQALRRAPLPLLLARRGGSIPPRPTSRELRRAGEMARKLVLVAIQPPQLVGGEEDVIVTQESELLRLDVRWREDDSSIDDLGVGPRALGGRDDLDLLLCPVDDAAEDVHCTSGVAVVEGGVFAEDAGEPFRRDARGAHEGKALFGWAGEVGGEPDGVARERVGDGDFEDALHQAPLALPAGGLEEDEHGVEVIRLALGEREGGVGEDFPGPDGLREVVMDGAVEPVGGA